VSGLRVLISLASVAAVLMTGCDGGANGSEAATETTWHRPVPRFLQVNLPGEATPEAAGFLLAHQRGYFRQAKFHAWFIAPSDPARPPMYVEQELVDAAIIHEPQLILAREEGKPLVAFGSLVPDPTMAMIWLKGSGIHDIADLKGKTIAIPGVRFQKDFLEAVLARGGLTLADVKLKLVSYFLESELVHGRADAIFGGSKNTEGRRLEAVGLDPVVIPVTKLGIPGYDELVFVARRDRYAKDPHLFQQLAQATARGGASVAGEPGVATKAIGMAEKTKIPTAPTLAGVREMAPRFSRSGHIDPARFQRLADWMYEQGMIERRWQASELLAGPGKTPDNG
jgi:putative hydroxymethylpyrimidine transport system substrate-binding protein